MLSYLCSGQGLGENRMILSVFLLKLQFCSPYINRAMLPQACTCHRKLIKFGVNIETQFLNVT